MIIGVLIGLCLLPLGVVTLVFVAEVALGLLGPGHRRPAGTVEAIRIAILVPAHNEEAGITATVSMLAARAPAATRILVVADNCTDSTAARARAAGAEVIERFDDNLRGKGFALAYGRDHLALVPPDCAIVIDADSIPEPGCLELLAQRTIADQRPVQACYLMEPARDAASFTRFSSFAFMIKNLVRQQGIERIGAPAVLTGCGMAFTWSVLANAPLATDEVAEDVALGVHLAMAGFAPRFESAARVSSAASSTAGTSTQRKRWESGFLRTARMNFIPLLRVAIERRDVRLAWLAFHLATPPFVLLIMANVAAAMLTIGLWFFGAVPALLAVVPVVFVVAALALVALAWVRYGRSMLSAGDLVRLPLYAAWKLRLSLSAIFRAERRWIRTERTP